MSTQTSEFNPGGIEHRVAGGALVPLGGQLPYYLELRTGKLLDVLLVLFSSQINHNKNQRVLREKINRWLFTKTRPGIYIELHSHFHLAYADQRDGHGTQHWWRLFFDEHSKEKVETASRSNALTVSKRENEDPNKGTPQSEYANTNSVKEWGGMYFRSECEIRIAEKLDEAGVLFFANARGRISRKDSPISSEHPGRLEVDFLVCHQGKCMVLEVDGKHHQENGQILRDYVRDRLLLKEGMSTVRFTAGECFHRASEVVSEFLKILISTQVTSIR
jgi:hypothetical protein